MRRRSGTVVLRVIESPGIDIPDSVGGHFERFQYVRTRETPAKDNLVQPGSRLLVFLSRKDGKWIFDSQFYNPLNYLSERDYGSRLQSLFKTPLYD